MHDVDSEAWSPEAAEEAAAQAGLALTAEHWKAITCWRELAARTGAVPELDRLKGCGFSISELRKLFPGDVSAVLSSLAGVPE